MPLPVGPETIQVNGCANLLSMTIMTKISNVHFYLYTKYQSSNPCLQLYSVRINIYKIYNIFRVWFKCLHHQWLRSRVNQSTLNVFFTQNTKFKHQGRYNLENTYNTEFNHECRSNLKNTKNTKFNHECHYNLKIHKMLKWNTYEIMWI